MAAGLPFLRIMNNHGSGSSVATSRAHRELANSRDLAIFSYEVPYLEFWPDEHVFTLLLLTIPILVFLPTVVTLLELSLREIIVMFSIIKYLLAKNRIPNQISKKLEK